MSILIIDNYDSFTYNLLHTVEAQSNQKVVVKRNDQVLQSDIDDCTHIIAGPGPGLPEEAGELIPILKANLDRKIILGVCLGHQALGQILGAKLKNLDRVYHGIASNVTTNNFQLLPNEQSCEVGRYHSWVIEKGTLPDTCEVTSQDENGEIMSFRHKTLPVYAVQFHPESILTPRGPEMIRGFLNLQ